MPKEEEKSEVSKSTQGKKNRASGARFELKVRSEMENLGWVVSKWMNTVDYDRDGKTGKLVPAKRKFNPFLKALGIGVGFPDFVCFRRTEEGNYEVVGLEAKGNGYLDSKERGMCHWLIDNKVFPRILVAKKGKKKGEVEFVDFSEKYKTDIRE
jgi:hypothetical protein